MNRIDNLFQRKRNRVLSVYMTAGYPELHDTVKIISALDKAGVDLIEIGMPFSDPLADGEVIQQSSHQALDNGMSIKMLFAQLQDIRQKTSIPLVLMGYLNPVLSFGFKKFLDSAKKAGIDGLIIPDLPLEIYIEEFKQMVEESGIKFIMLITPQTDDKRIEEIVTHSSGFLYVVADSSTTGTRDRISESQKTYFNRIKSMKLALPGLIGFGISNYETFDLASEYANGAIIGSAFIKSLKLPGNKATIEERVIAFVNTITHP